MVAGRADIRGLELDYGRMRIPATSELGSGITKLLCGLAAIPLTVAAIAGGASAATAVAETVNGQPATVGVARDGNLGSVLVDSQPRSPSLFQTDTGTRGDGKRRVSYNADPVYVSTPVAATTALRHTR
jgi:hypothetical protein